MSWVVSQVQLLEEGIENEFKLLNQDDLIALNFIVKNKPEELLYFLNNKVSVTAIKVTYFAEIIILFFVLFLHKKTTMLPRRLN